MYLYTNIRYYAAFVIYCTLLFLFYCINNYCHVFELNFNGWDAHWYGSIVENGYKYIEGTQSNTAFFPLFPYLWKFTGMDSAGIAFLNVLIFGVSFCWLAILLKISLRLFVFILCFPLSLFFSLPYTESCFFLGVVVIVAGLVNKQIALSLLGIMLASLTRPVFPVFMCMLILVSVIFYLKVDRNVLKIYKPFLVVLVVLLLCFGLVNWIQYYQTGVWFAQSKTYQNWGGVLSFPTFPLNSFEQYGPGYFVLQLDYLAMVWGIYCAYLVFRLFKEEILWDRSHLIFSGCSVYMIIIFLLRLFTMHGSLWSLSRYIFATPIFIYSLWFVLNIHKGIISDLKKTYWWHFLLTVMFVDRGIPNTYLKFSSVFVSHAFIFPYLKLNWSDRVWSALFAILCIILFLIQLFLIRCFHLTLWVG